MRHSFTRSQNETARRRFQPFAGSNGSRLIKRSFFETPWASIGGEKTSTF